MTKAKTSTKTMGDAALEPALFTHDGYRLHVFDGVPCMLDTDLGKRLGMTEAKAIRRLTKRQESNRLLVDGLGHRVPNSSQGLRRRFTPTTAKGGRPGVTHYLTQAQVRWIVIKSETPEADVLLRQLLSVCDDWEKGQLVSRAEAAEAKLTRPRVEPQTRAFNRSLFAYGVPRAVPSNVAYAIARDPRFTRFHTSIGITGTLIGDGITVVAQDLGFVTGGECTLTARTATRPLLPHMRVMGADPAHDLEVRGVRDVTSTETHYFLNHVGASGLGTADRLTLHGSGP